MTQDSNSNNSAADAYKVWKAGEITFQVKQKKSKYPFERLTQVGDSFQVGKDDKTFNQRAYAARKNYNDKGQGRVEVKKASGFVYLVREA